MNLVFHNSHNIFVLKVNYITLFQMFTCSYGENFFLIYLVVLENTT